MLVDPVSFLKLNEDSQSTPLLRPFSESLSHFTKSALGAGGPSSFGAEVMIFAGTTVAGAARAAPLVVPREAEATLAVDVA
jgi:hypothetical protein